MCYFYLSLSLSLSLSYLVASTQFTSQAPGLDLDFGLSDSIPQSELDAKIILLKLIALIWNFKNYKCSVTKSLR